MHGVLNIYENKNKLHRETKSFKPSYFMIGQYLPNKNESAIVLKFKTFLDLNKA